MKARMLSLACSQMKFESLGKSLVQILALNIEYLLTSVVKVGIPYVMILVDVVQECSVTIEFDRTE